VTSGGTNFTNFLENQIDQSVCLPFFCNCFCVLCIFLYVYATAELNNSEIRYTKNYVFSWRGVYTPPVRNTVLRYIPCMSTPLLSSHHSVRKLTSLILRLDYLIQ